MEHKTGKNEYKKKGLRKTTVEREKRKHNF